MSLTDLQMRNVRDGLQGGVLREALGGLAGPDPGGPVRLRQAGTRTSCYVGADLLNGFQQGFWFGGNTSAAVITFSIIWMVLSVFLQAVLGISVALVLERPGVRFANAWRSCSSSRGRSPRPSARSRGWTSRTRSRACSRSSWAAPVPWRRQPGAVAARPAPGRARGWAGRCGCSSRRPGCGRSRARSTRPPRSRAPSRWRSSRSVTLPLLVPLLAAAFVVRGVATFNQFYLFYVLGHGLPDDDAGDVQLLAVQLRVQSRAVLGQRRDQRRHARRARRPRRLVPALAAARGAGGVPVRPMRRRSPATCPPGVPRRSSALFVLLPVWVLVLMATDGSHRRLPVGLPPDPGPADARPVRARRSPGPVRSSTTWGLLRNSLLVSVSSALVALVLGATMAYAFARMRFPGSDVGLVAVLLGVFLPPVALAAAAVPPVQRVRARGAGAQGVGLPRLAARPVDRVRVVLDARLPLADAGRVPGGPRGPRGGGVRRWRDPVHRLPPDHPAARHAVDPRRRARRRSSSPTRSSRSRGCSSRPTRT